MPAEPIAAGGNAAVVVTWTVPVIGEAQVGSDGTAVLTVEAKALEWASPALL